MTSKMCSTQLLVVVVMMVVIALSIRPSLGATDVKMIVSYEDKPTYFINVTFTLDLLNEFYKCMCKKQTGSCSAKYSEGNSHQVNKILTSQTQGQDDTRCGLFRCKNSRSLVSVTCTKLDQQQPSCTIPNFITLPNSVTCDFTCVGIDWTYTEEGLFINDSRVKDQYCNNQCCSTTSTPLPFPTTSPGKTQSENTSIWQTYDTEPSYKETIIISGVAAGLVFVAVVVVIIIFLVKRKLRPVSTSHGKNLTPGGVTNAHTAGRNKTSRQNNGFSRNTNSSQGQPNSRWAAGFIGALRGQRNQGQGAHTTGHNSTASEVNSNWQFVETDLKPPSEESEYAIIDEAQMQPGDSTSNGNSGATIGDYANDGYISLDYFDYDNIKDTPSPRNYTNKNSYQNNRNLAQSNFQEIQPSSSSGSNEIGEYSVAKRIVDDTDNVNKVGLVSSTETPGHTCGGEEGTRQPPDRPTLDQFVVNDSTDIGDGSKKNPYFELCKEEEEDSTDIGDGSKKNPYFELCKEEEEEKEEEDEDSIEKDNESKRKSYF